MMWRISLFVLLFTSVPGNAQPLPEFTKAVFPAYPELAALTGMETYLVAEFKVDADGTVQGARIVEAGNRSSLFAGATLNALGQWQFKVGEGQDRITYKLRFAFELLFPQDHEKAGVFFDPRAKTITNRRVQTAR